MSNSVEVEKRNATVAVAERVKWLYEIVQSHKHTNTKLSDADALLHVVGYRYESNLMMPLTTAEL